MPKPTAAMLAAIVALTLAATGCSAVRATRNAVKAGKNIAHTVEANKATIDTFTTSIKSSEGTTFEATYVTTGKSPATIVYAVQPPKGVAFSDTPANNGSGRIDIVANTTGEYLCTPTSKANTAWTCQKAKPGNAATEAKLFDFYTPSHWVTFLQDFSLAAGFAGDKVSSSTKTVNGFAMKCVDFRAGGVKGTSTICTTSQGILGYVKVAENSTSFEIASYSATPSPSLFQLPSGAKVVPLKSPAS